MEQSPSRLEENFHQLSKIMVSLKEFRNKVASKRAHQMASWLENVNSKLEEFKALEKEVMKPIRFGFLQRRHTLNRSVLEMLKLANILAQVGNDFSDTIESLFNHLAEGKPKQYSYANLVSYTKNFSTEVESNEDWSVFSGVFPNGEQVHVRTLSCEDYAEPIFLSEINTMFKTSHRNLMKLHGFCFEEKIKALVFACSTNGSLERVLSKTHPGTIEWENLYNIAIGTGKGLSYLHDGCDEHLIHRDLSTSNVHLDQSYSPKITNFGMMKLLDTLKAFHMSRRPKLIGSYFDAPELWEEDSYVTYKCDVYSFGVILFDMLWKHTSLSRNDCWMKFEEGEVEELLRECRIAEENRKEAKILCMVGFWCTKKDPEHRPSMSTVVKMLEKEIQVVSPLDPSVITLSHMKSYREAVY